MDPTSSRSDKFPLLASSQVPFVAELRSKQDRKEIPWIFRSSHRTVTRTTTLFQTVRTWNFLREVCNYKFSNKIFSNIFVVMVAKWTTRSYGCHYMFALFHTLRDFVPIKWLRLERTKDPCKKIPNLIRDIWVKNYVCYEWSFVEILRKSFNFDWEFLCTGSFIRSFLSINKNLVK